MTVFARYLSSSDNLAPAAGRMNNKSAENPANVIIRLANVYKRVAPLISMFCSRILCELPLQRTAVHQIPWQKSPQMLLQSDVDSETTAKTLAQCGPDDYSRTVAGYFLSFESPSSLNTKSIVEKNSSTRPLPRETPGNLWIVPQGNVMFQKF